MLVSREVDPGVANVRGDPESTLLQQFGERRPLAGGQDVWLPRRILRDEIGHWERCCLVVADRRLDPLQQTAKLCRLSGFGEFARQERDGGETLTVIVSPDPAAVGVKLLGDCSSYLLKPPDRRFSAGTRPGDRQHRP